MPGDMTRRVAASATFLASLDSVLSRPTEIDQTTLIDLHGREGLRRQERLVTFLVKRLGLSWDARAGAVHSARRVTLAALNESIDAGWHEDLVAFSATLRQSARPLSDRTVKSYVSAARGLLEAAGIEHASDLTQRHVKSWLRHRPGRTNDVYCFLSWLKEAGGPELEVRFRAGKTVRVRECATLRKAKTFIDQLTACDDPRKGRALLAWAITTIHGVRLEKVLAMRRNDVVPKVDRVELRIDDTIVDLCPILSNAFLRFADRSADMPFAGRAGIAPYSVDSARYFLRGTRIKNIKKASYRA